MSLIGHEIDDFTVNAYQQGEYKQISKKSLLGKWSIVFF